MRHLFFPTVLGLGSTLFLAACASTTPTHQVTIERLVSITNIQACPADKKARYCTKSDPVMVCRPARHPDLKHGHLIDAKHNLMVCSPSSDKAKDESKKSRDDQAWEAAKKANNKRLAKKPSHQKPKDLPYWRAGIDWVHHDVYGAALEVDGFEHALTRRPFHD